MKQFVSTLIIYGVLAGLGQPFLEFLTHSCGEAACAAPPQQRPSAPDNAAAPEGEAPPEIGSGRVAGYLLEMFPSFGVERKAERLETDPEQQETAIRWVAAEIAKIEQASKLLYESERNIAETNWTDTDRYDEQVARIAKAAAISKEEVLDGVSLFLFERMRRERHEKQAQSEAMKAESTAKQTARFKRRVPYTGHPIVLSQLGPEQRAYLKREADRREMTLDEYLAERAKPPILAKRGQEGGMVADLKRAGYVQLPGGAWVNPKLEEAKALAQAAAANANMAAQQQALTNALLWQLLNQPPASPSPLVNSDPYYENVSQIGNQTFINGNGPYGPFYENITRIGNQTFINGSGVPFAPLIVAPQGDGQRHRGGFGGGF